MMIVKTLFVILCTLFPLEVCANYETLGDFKRLNMDHEIVFIQEDPLFLMRLLSDLQQNAEPFTLGLFGYSRLKIGELANETQLAVNDLTKAKMTKKQTKCVEDNKKIIVLILIDAMSNWQCIRGHLINLVDIVKPLWETLFGFSLLHEEECSFGPFCLMSKGIETARLTAQMVEHGGRILKFCADFVLGLRVCQHQVAPFKQVINAVLQNIKICTLLK